MVRLPVGISASHSLPWPRPKFRSKSEDVFYKRRHVAKRTVEQVSEALGLTKSGFDHIFDSSQDEISYGLTSDYLRWMFYAPGKDENALQSHCDVGLLTVG